MVVEWRVKKKNMQRSISVGIDIGTKNTKVVVLEAQIDEKTGRRNLKIIGQGLAPSRGLKQGFIADTKDATKSLKEALKNAEKASGVKIVRAFASASGIGLASNIFHGAISLSKNDNEVSDQDITRVIESTKIEIPQAFSQNRKVLHTIPLQYKIDGKIIYGKPQGLRGSKLEVRVLSISSLLHHLNDIVNVIEDADLKVEDIIAGPYALSKTILSKAQKKAGVLVADIGAETTSIIVFEDDNPISLEVFPVGTNSITNDIALGLKISLEEAEEINVGGRQGLYPKKKIDDIIQARLTKIFELIEAHLKKIGKNGLLPAGIIIAGGGSKISYIEEFAKQYLRLPSRKIEEKPEWALSYSMAYQSLSPEDEIRSDQDISISGIRRFLKEIGQNLKQIGKQMLP